jgi:hypothetical protein
MFTDFLNNPINVGDVIVYPQSQGSSSAHIQTGRVVHIDEMVKDLANGEVYLYSKRNKRDAYSHLRWPTFSVLNPHYDDSKDFDWTTNPKWVNVDDNAKAYQLKVQKIKFSREEGRWVDEGKPVTIKNVDRCTVITALADFS